jgi:hypothetical protein
VKRWLAFLCLPCTFLCKGTRSYEMYRFHFTCLFCRWRRWWLGKFNGTFLNGILVPVKFVKWYLPWSAAAGNIQEMIIDSSGHCKMLRCSAVIVFVNMAYRVFKLIAKLPPKSHRVARKWLMAPWVNLAELVSNVTV